MGRLFVVNLEGKIYSCKHCRTHLALCEDIISKAFRSRHGRAYLFNKVANTSVGEKEERMMMTGMHTVADIFCVGCGSMVGWKYVRIGVMGYIERGVQFIFPFVAVSYSDGFFQEAAYEKNQKYKEGKSVLERVKVLGPDGSNYCVHHETQISGSDGDDA